MIFSLALGDLHVEARRVEPPPVVVAVAPSSARTTLPFLDGSGRLR